MTKNEISVISTAACPHSPDPGSGPREVAVSRSRPSRAIDILTISNNPTLGIYLSGLFQRSGWSIARARTCEAGLSFLRDGRAAVAVCEESLPDGSWQDAAAALRPIPGAPALVVVSDDHSLVHEVLALGVFDLLIRPLRESDVAWTIASAWRAAMERFAKIEAGEP